MWRGLTRFVTRAVAPSNPFRKRAAAFLSVAAVACLLTLCLKKPACLQAQAAFDYGQAALCDPEVAGAGRMGSCGRNTSSCRPLFLLESELHF